MFPYSFRSPKKVARTLAVLVQALLVILVIGRGEAPRVWAQGLPSDYHNFEGPQVHPLALTPDGTRLLAVNTPNNTLSVFYLSGGVLTLTAEIPVGLEPVSVAVRNDREAWVANWLSDSVSVVNLANGHVTRTIETGDEPTDVIFAGVERELAFVCVSGLSQVKVFDPNALDVAAQTIDIRGKQPRSLARDATGAEVFVSIFESGNQTTVVPFRQVAAAGGPPPPSPAMSAALPFAPQTALVVKWNGSGWADERGDAKWTSFIPYTLADVDLVMIDASRASASVSREVRGVGTNIGNAVLDSASKRLYVVNLEAHNEIRFEPNLRGRFLSNRVSLIDLAGNNASVTPFDLNAHINAGVPAGSDDERAKSLALPADIARGPDGTLYVAATGSAKVGVLDANGAVQARIGVGHGPTGLALDSGRNRLYVLNRFDETLSVVDLSTRAEIFSVPVGFNPEPANVRAGRRLLYDASLSAHGDLSCASCHLNAHRDGLAWDLGDPQGKMQTVNNPFANLGIITLGPSTFHPMKGPMTTQSLRGLTGTEPLHWRGDRAGLADFNQAFVSLLGGTRQLDSAELADFETFVRSLNYPPNPREKLDRTIPNPPTGPSAQRGAQLFSTARLDAGVLTCNQCHAATPGFGSGTNRAIIPAQAIQESQDIKVPQLRGLYQKTGMQNSVGEQLTGFGFIHDGSVDNLLDFLRLPVFTFRNDDDRRDVEQFVLAMDTGTAPAVGLQATVSDGNRNSSSIVARINLLVAQADAGNCDLVANGSYGGARRGFLYTGQGLFQTDKRSEQPLATATLLQAAGSELTFTGVPVGAGRRLAIDRNGDGTLNGDEPPAPNALDTAQFFVAQHYLDFLGREADAGGLGYWSNQITQCGDNAACINSRRIGVSAAFFIELEFQETGSFVYRMYRAAYGARPGFAEFMPDRSRIIAGDALEASKQTFAEGFVQRASFQQRYPLSLSNAEFVNQLFDAAGLKPFAAERQQQIDAMTSSGRTRAQVMREVIELPEFKQREYNPSFVLMQYFGYLRRDPDEGGYLFWLDVLNNREPGNYRGMVCSFITSKEYQERFGSTISHSNRECAP